LIARGDPVERPLGGKAYLVEWFKHITRAELTRMELTTDFMCESMIRSRADEARFVCTQLQNSYDTINNDSKCNDDDGGGLEKARLIEKIVLNFYARMATLSRAQFFNAGDSVHVPWQDLRLTLGHYRSQQGGASVAKRVLMFTYAAVHTLVRLEWIQPYLERDGGLSILEYVTGNMFEFGSPQSVSDLQLDLAHLTLWLRSFVKEILSNVIPNVTMQRPDSEAGTCKDIATLPTDTEMLREACTFLREAVALVDPAKRKGNTHLDRYVSVVYRLCDLESVQSVVYTADDVHY
jgi:hypothetical protein